MSVRQLTIADIEAAVMGGKFLGGGGGGWTNDGLEFGRLAMEKHPPLLVTPDELQDGAIVLTVALVGAPAAQDRHVETAHFLRAVQRLETELGARVAGVVTNENGAAATVNGWVQAANLGIPVVDAPCNGRAHPTGVMGSLGLHRLPDYVSVQAAVGGRGERYVEAVVRGSLQQTAVLVRHASVQAGGLVAVARNPVTAKYAHEHGAVGGIGQAIDLGHRVLKASRAGGRAVIDAALDFLGGQKVAQGLVEDVILQTEGGFDVGFVTIADVEMTFWNEYMTLERHGQRLATFPDLVMTVDTESGLPLITAEIERGQSVTVVVVPRQNLKLGAGMRDRSLFTVVEKAVEKEICKYVFPTSVNLV
ncbi:DUF917 family protein [Alicyclobacillus fastidiosus]|uniref:DUF917 family protein n=1 Tax=Alicyclobacillus fastidiosus TaxID=392011 RepID=A0ABY6ZIZ5_9BACL|nr:DUF917 family protein [Alicyclobacillus fastidiosus]WAH42089.1 DUF917 family protein [Alicyclobacillus fastidiosus]GMA63856.1 hypothetical protein GCM10025859_42960 [Alicyclobacillus fastidiosus]